MTKQDEIREGIYQIIKDNCQSASGWVGNKAYTMDLIMNFLSDYGVVIKVDIEAGPYPAELRVCQYFEPLVEYHQDPPKTGDTLYGVPLEVKDDKSK